MTTQQAGSVMECTQYNYYAPRGQMVTRDERVQNVASSFVENSVAAGKRQPLH